jgi:hypothetical protein
MEPNLGEKEATVEWQGNLNDEVVIHSLRTACQEATEANPEKMELIDSAIAILEKMEGKSRGNGI